MGAEFITSFLGLYGTEISQKTISLFSSFLVERKLPKDYFVRQEIKETKNFYILKSGIIASYAKDKKSDKEYIRVLYDEKTIFANLLSPDEQYNSTLNYYKCLSDCVIYEGDYQEFANATLKNHRLSILYNRMLELAYLKTKKRVDELLFMDASERYKDLKNSIPNIENLIPQYQIASFLNITPVQLSRIRRKIYSK